MEDLLKSVPERLGEWPIIISEMLVSDLSGLDEGSAVFALGNARNPDIRVYKEFFVELNLAISALPRVRRHRCFVRFSRYLQELDSNTMNGLHCGYLYISDDSDLDDDEELTEKPTRDIVFRTLR
jgi:hypothetical protein